MFWDVTKPVAAPLIVTARAQRSNARPYRSPTSTEAHAVLDLLPKLGDLLQRGGDRCQRRLAVALLDCSLHGVEPIVRPSGLLLLQGAQLR